MLKKISTYAFGGILGFFVQIILVTFLKEFFNLWFLLAYAIALGGSIVFAFYFHKKLTFSKKTIRKRSFHKFTGYFLAANGCTYLLVGFFVEFMKFPYLAVIATVPVVVGILNFAVADAWIF
ncbi:MAG: GtrA family protein [Nanoarchaeota archaeon]|nr:GtrA family protein [Nanoarchaeota archaeon]